MRLTRAWMALAMVGSLGTSGCTLEIVDPLGTDASVEGSWTIDGAAPSVASCEAAGITHVRVRVWEPDIEEYTDPSSLVFPCEDGFFDTGDAVLRDGSWRLQLLALDANADDVVVAEGPREFFDTLAEDGHVVMSSVDFVGGVAGTSMQASWTINGETPTADNCAGLGIDEVLVEIVSGPGAGTTLKAMCDEGSLAAAIDPGSYEVRVVASSLDTGEIAATEITDSFTVADGESYVINGGPIDYIGGFDPLGTDAALQASWMIGGVAADDKACEAVLGSTVDILFYAADDTTFENGVVVASGAPCGDGAFDSVDPILAAGDYLLAAELRDSTDALISRSETASPFTVAAGTPVTVDLDFRLDSATVHVFFEWENPSAAGSYTDCAAAGVEAMHWELYRDDGTTSGEFVAGQDVGMNIACADFANIMGGADGGALVPGDYELVLQGFEGGFKAWEPMPVCSLSIDGDGGLGLATCRAAYQAPL